MNIWQLARVGDLKKFKSVVKSKSVQELNETDQFGFTCFHWAAQKGEDEIVALLIKRQVFLDAVDGDLQTPLHWAIDKAHKSIARMLIEHGAALDIQDKFGHSALHRAAALGQRDIVELLLQSGANPNLQNQNGWTALHVTCYYAHHKIVRELLLCSRTDVNVPNKDGWTPLHCAAMQGHGDLCDLLIRRNGYVDYTSQDGSTPLHLAAQENRLIVVQLLLNYGANSNLRNGRGRRPIDLASSEVVKTALKAAAQQSVPYCVLFGGVDKALVDNPARFFILPPYQIASNVEAKDFSMELIYEGEGSSDKNGEEVSSKGSSRSGKKGTKRSAITMTIQGQVTRCTEEDATIPVSYKEKGKEKDGAGSPTKESIQPALTAVAPRSPRAPTTPRKSVSRFMASYTPTMAGRYRLMVTCKGEQLAQCPVPVAVSAAVTDATKSEVSLMEDGSSFALVGRPTKILIQTRNQLGDDRIVGGDSFDVEITRQERDEGASKRNILLKADELSMRVEDSSDGRYVVWFSPQTTGTYFVDVKLQGVRLPGAPVRVNVVSESRRKSIRSPRAIKKNKADKDNKPTPGKTNGTDHVAHESNAPVADSVKLLSARSIPVNPNPKKEKRLSTKNAGHYILPSTATKENEDDVWERLEELEKANFALKQKQLEFEKEKYDLHKQISQLQRKLEKKGTAREEGSKEGIGEEELQQKMERLASQAEQATRELHREKARHLCRVCKTHEREMVVLPCLHATFCALCVSRMQNCALCSASLQGFLRIKPD